MPNRYQEGRINRSRGILWLVVRVCVSIGILGYLVSLLDWTRVGQVLLLMDIRYVWIAPALVITGLWLAAIRWKVVLKHFRTQLSTFESFCFYLIASFYSIVLPGVLGGDIVRTALCAAATGRSFGSVISSIIVERTVGILVVLLIALLAVNFISNDVWNELDLQVRHSLITGIAMLLGMIVIGWLFIKRVAVKLSGIARMHSLARVAKRLSDAASKVPPGSFVVVLLLTAGFQLLDICSTYFLARAVNLELDLSSLLLIMPIVYIATIIPISLGGLGVREGALTYCLALFSIPATDAVTLALLVYLNRVLVALVGGSVQLLWPPVRRKQCASGGDHRIR